MFDKNLAIFELSVSAKIVLTEVKCLQNQWHFATYQYMCIIY